VYAQRRAFNRMLIEYVGLVQQGDHTMKQERNPERAAGTAGSQDEGNTKNAGYPGSQN